MAVPEGLPLMIAIVSALNMGKMLKDNVLVRKIAGIETAGSLNILFSDKTGTITKGQLEAVVFVDGKGRRYKTCAEVPDKLGQMLTACITENTTAMINGTKRRRKGHRRKRHRKSCAGICRGSTLLRNDKVCFYPL